jgi:hypothetical protein
VSDEAGRFAFDALPEGEFTLTVVRPGFLNMVYGATKPNRPGTPIRLGAGQRVDVAMALSRGGALAGTITGSNGEPLVQAQVRAMRVTTNAGIRSFAQTGYAMTDDRGAYRLFNLVPGEYVIAATANASDLGTAERTLAEVALFEEALARARQTTTSGTLPPAIQVSVPGPVPPAGQPAVYAPVYYPGTPAASDALTVTIGADSERLGVDFSATPVLAGWLVGSITGAPDAVLRYSYDQASGGMTQSRTAVMVTAIPDDPKSDPAAPSGTAADEQGKFRIYNLAPGRYTVFAQTRTAIVQRTGASSPSPAPTGDSVLWGRTTVEVDERSTPEITIALQPARTVSGRVEFDMSSPGAERPRALLTATRAPSSPPISGSQPAQAQVAADGTFTMSGVVPGHYLFNAFASLIKSAMVNGQDAQDFPFEMDGDRDISNVVITLTDKSSELSGTVMQPSGAPATEYTVVIAPADRRYWTPGSRRIQFTRPSTTGRYVIRDLPAGSYLLAAVTDLEPGTQYDPEFLKALAGAAVPVTIADGGRHTQDIRVAR